MTRGKPDKLEKRAAALRANLRRRKPKTGAADDDGAKTPAKPGKKKKSKE